MEKPCKTKCNPDAHSYSSGFIGKNAEQTRLMIIANRADSRLNERTLFGTITHEQALRESESGRALQHILDSAGLTWDDIYFTNAFKCILPEDREPNTGEYSACAEHLHIEIAEFQPVKILSCGRKAYAALFPELPGKNALDAIAGSIIQYENSIPAMVTYHLSRIERMPVRFRREVSAFLSQ